MAAHEKVSYEQLCEEPDQIMKDVSKFLGISFENTMLSPEFDGQAFHGNSAYGKIGSAVSVSSVSRWKEQLSDAEIRGTERKVGKRLIDAGYIPRFSEEMKKCPPLEDSKQVIPLAPFLRHLTKKILSPSIGVLVGFLFGKLL